MQGDVNAGDGNRYDEAADGGERAEDESAGTGAAGFDEEILPKADNWLDPAVVEIVVNLDRIVRPTFHQVGPMMTEAARSLARQAWQQSEVEKSLRELALRVTAPLEEALHGLNASVISRAESAVADLMAANFRGFDQLTATSARYAEYSATARLAERALGFGALTSWRVSLQANSQIEQLVKSVAQTTQPHVSLYGELSRISRSQAGLTDWIVQQDATNRLLGEVSGRPLARWRDYLGGLSPELTLRDVRTSLLSGSAGLGIISADVLTSGVEDTELIEASAGRIEADVLRPWEEGRFKLGRDLRERLGTIDSSVPELLAGAWDDLGRNGPAAVEKAAHCITEVLDRTLRAAAPDTEVREWHAHCGRPQAEWEGRDRPPHSLRVKFLAERLGGERTVVVAQFDSLACLHKALRGRLQAIKHASAGDLMTVRNLLLCAEKTC